jgi:hypothetical protein
MDPWGHAYIYKFPGDHGDEPDIISYGADGQPGGSPGVGAHPHPDVVAGPHQAVEEGVADRLPQAGDDPLAQGVAG